MLPPTDDHPSVLRKAFVLVALVGAVLFPLESAASAGRASEPTQVPAQALATTSTTEGDLPGTSVEAEQRDQGDTSAAPWLIGAGVAALASVIVGGLVLKRRST